MPVFSTLLGLSLTTSRNNNNNNRTLVTRGNVVTGPIGYPYSGARRSKINGLPGGLKYASADIPELQESIVIQADDPNANGFAGRRAGGGKRADIYGNE